MSYVATFALALLTTAQSSRGESADGIPDLRCGSHCLYLCLKTLPGTTGLSTFEAFDEALGPPGPTGYTMLELSNEVMRHNAHILAVETTLNELQSRQEQFICITIINDNHYVVVYDIDDEFVYVVDVPRNYKLPRDVFTQIWSRKCLLLSSRPLSPRRDSGVFELGMALLSNRLLSGSVIALIVGVIWGIVIRLRHRSASKAVVLAVMSFTLTCGVGCMKNTGAKTSGDAPPSQPIHRGHRPLIVDPDHVDFGVVRPENAMRENTVRSKLHNSTTSEIKINEILIGCSCVEARVAPNPIPPRSSAEVISKIKGGSVQGRRSSGLVLITSGPSREKYSLTYEWAVLAPLRSQPLELSLPNLRGTNDAPVTIQLLVNDMNVCRNCDVRSRSSSGRLNLSFAKFEGFDHKSHDPASTQSRRGDQVLGRLAVTLPSSLPTGPHAETIAVLITCDGEERALIHIPVHWMVKPSLLATPDRVSLGLRKPGQVVIQGLLLTADRGPAFQVRSVSFSVSSALLKSEVVRIDDSAARISMRFQLPRVQGPWRGELSIETDLSDTGTLTLPVSAYIQEINE